MMAENAIEIYTSKNGVELAVALDESTVWLSLDQMSALFERDKSTISRHIKNVFTEGELDQDSVVALFATTAADEKIYQVAHYNLDVIISVGYRVKSIQGTRFRQWANTVLKNYLVDGAAINEKRLKQIGTVVNILSRSNEDMVSGIASVLQDFTNGLDLLDSYDHQTLKKPKGEVPERELTYDEARAFIDTMSFNETSDLFGHERDGSFKGVVAGLYQSFGGVELYPSVEEKAANLLYLVVKDHSFTDGNKRIAAALFVYFLEMNNALRSVSGNQRIDNNTLAAITLMIALSAPEEKEIMCLLVMNMLAG